MKFSKFTLIAVAILSFGFLFVQCTKEGPAGPAGADGTNGTNGTDGTPGVDANSFCIDCHSAAGMNAIYTDWAGSGHGEGAYVSYAGYRGSCAPCHSNELFQAFLANTAGWTTTDIDNPTAIGCATCHSNHTTLEEGLTAPLTAETATWFDGTTDMDLDGPSNLCMNCHRSRRGVEDYYAYAGDTIILSGDTTIITTDGTHGYINSTHAGPHHGPQGDIVLGLGGIVAAGTYTHAHQGVGCVGCHMGEDRAHTFQPVAANCSACHSGMPAISDFSTRMDAIHAALETAGAVDAAGHPLKAVVTMNQLKAFWNFIYLEEDRSNGAHNPDFADAMLTECETLLGL